MKSRYGQFCPVAVASEIFAERWTPIILRELVLGSRGFNEIHRGVPRISRALLAKRLRELTASGVIEAADGEYRLTDAGQELGEVDNSLGTWGARWTAPVQRDRLDARLLTWDMRRRFDVERLPEKRTVVRFDFRGVPAVHKARASGIRCSTFSASFRCRSSTRSILAWPKRRASARWRWCASAVPTITGCRWWARWRTSSPGRAWRTPTGWR